MDKKFDVIEFLSSISTVMPLAGVQCGFQPTRNLGVQLTLFQPGGQITACPPGFENLTATLVYKQSGFEIPNFFNCPSIIYGCSLLSEINSSSLLCELFIGKKAKEWILKVPFFGLKIDGKRTGAENDILQDVFGDMLSPLEERNFLSSNRPSHRH